ncbi:putative ulk ulk protein kinase [Diaporthe ampelina]|uniref:non-specific serine/threonine protein kinase n=1 Tax=Diaporthe ampelina TaxID=1214573 RepID=A0A0G2FH69_9PEZI|nr:putative ulk ulk protein kinase [Diaporthe ampelina]
MSQWTVGSKIGKGSFASVYVGTHKSSGAAVAIKSVELGKLKGKVKDNLYSEIKILEKLRHPHIVALHECVETPTHINLMMEYCLLGDLSLFIKKRDMLSTNPATHDMARKYPNTPNAGLNEVIIRHFLKQLTSALEFLRRLNLVHRDVKPQNLLLLPSVDFRESNREVPQILSASQDSLIPAVGLRSLPMLKLADFGFARVLPSTSLAETLCGSPLYMAPEILRYERYDAKADLWSVGTVLYEMAAGRPPFRASNHVELLRKIEASNDSIKFPRESNLSSDMKLLIRALLKRNPVERITFENFFAHPVVRQNSPVMLRLQEEIAFERDYVLVDKNQVAVNALADELAANGRLIGDGKQSTPYDEDSRVAQCIEDYATRSDVVYGFAEVKYKQLVPLTPSTNHGLGGLPADQASSDDDEGLTIDAVVALSEEALVLYVKALSLLAKSMDIASLWWSRRTRAESSAGPASARDPINIQVVITRINSAVQWVRSRFNEVLEKAEIVRLKLIDAQKALPEDHPGHPSNHPVDPASTSGSTVDGVVITPGISAEKLMYDRAVEMSRKAAIDEISNEDLAGCEISYVTAVRMLEAVIDNDEDLPKRRVSGPAKEEHATKEELASDINTDDQQAVQKCE